MARGPTSRSVVYYSIEGSLRQVRCYTLAVPICWFGLRYNSSRVEKSGCKNRVAITLHVFAALQQRRSNLLSGRVRRNVQLLAHYVLLEPQKTLSSPSSTSKAAHDVPKLSGTSLPHADLQLAILIAYTTVDIQRSCTPHLHRLYIWVDIGMR